MYDQLVSKATLLAATMWSVGAILMASAWVVMLTRPGAWRWDLMLAATSLMATGVAMTMQFRCYVLRLVALIRLTNGITEGPTREFHSVP